MAEKHHKTMKHTGILNVSPDRHSRQNYSELHFSNLLERPSKNKNSLTHGAYTLSPTPV